MEKDDEWTGVTGSHLNFVARIYDSRISRFLSIDPLARKYPYESNYIFSGNNPIYFVDNEGKYKMSAEDQEKSKMFTSYLKNVISEITSSEAIMGGLEKYGQLSAEDVDKVIEWNKGPKIEIVDELPYGASGYYTGGKDGTIQINQSLIDDLKNASDEDKQAALLHLISTVLHETVHYGDSQDGDVNDNQKVTYTIFVTDDGEEIPVYKPTSEKGHLFEADVYNDDENGEETIDDLKSAKKVVDEKSQTTEGKKDLPTVPKKETK